MADPRSNSSWLPEMLEELDRRWSPALPWEQYPPLCDRFTELRLQLRQARGVKNPHLSCRHCGKVHEMLPWPVTIRSILFALRKRGRITDETLAQMDADWKRYRAKHRLDGAGRKCATPGTEPVAAPATVPRASEQMPGLPGGDTPEPHGG